MKVQYIVVEFPVFMEDNIEPLNPKDEQAIRKWVSIAGSGDFKIISADRIEDAHMG